MGKLSKDIIDWGVVKPFFDKTYRFNTIDIETVDNELFLFGYVKDQKYNHHLSKFYNQFHDLLIDSVQSQHDILTWSRYDNTHLIKMIISGAKDINHILLRIGKVSPIYEYRYKDFNIEIKSIIKDSIIFKITDDNERSRYCTLYNLKNLFTQNLEKTAKDYNVNWYSKLGEEYHIIDKERYFKDKEYRRMVLLSNEYDNRVLIEIATKFLENFKTATGVYPKSIFTAGSIARSYLLASNKDKKIKLNFTSCFNKGEKRDQLLDYSMMAYHGGKIESYVLGTIRSGEIIDITSAYPYALSKLPKMTKKIVIEKGSKNLNKYFYAFIKCNVMIDDPKLIHPCIIENPLNKSNISPYGYLKEIIITKLEYDYLVKKNCHVEVIDYVAIVHEESYPYHDLVMDLFKKRMNAKNDKNNSLADLFKTILNSLYGITFELTDIYMEDDKNVIQWLGLRAGDYFNSVIASYITSFTRTYLSEVSHNIIENGGEVYLNMTDSIIFDGKVTLDVFSETKILGKFESPEKIKDIVILGAGRYEYKNDFSEKYTIKNRGFSVSVKDVSFYSMLNLKEKVKIKHRTFVTSFKATTKKYDYKQMGHLIDDDYEINPFNLGGKRIINNLNVNLNKSYTKTKPVYIEKEFYEKIQTKK